MNALGMVEVFGFTTAIVCADAAAKAAAVKIIALDTTKPANGDSAEVPLVMIVKMEGSVSAVTAGVAAAKAQAEQRGLYIVSHIISRPGPDIEKLAYLCKVGNEPIGKKSVKKEEPKIEKAPEVTASVMEEETDPVASAPKKRGRPAKAKSNAEPEQQTIGE